MSGRAELQKNVSNFNKACLLYSWDFCHNSAKPKRFYISLINLLSLKYSALMLQYTSTQPRCAINHRICFSLLLLLFFYTSLINTSIRGMLSSLFVCFKFLWLTGIRVLKTWNMFPTLVNSCATKYSCLSWANSLIDIFLFYCEMLVKCRN